MEFTEFDIRAGWKGRRMWSDGYNLAAVCPALWAGIWKGMCLCTARTDFWLKSVFYNCLHSHQS